MTGKEFAKILQSGKYKFTGKSIDKLSIYMDSIIEKYKLTQFCTHISPWVPGKPLLKYDSDFSKNGYITFSNIIVNEGLNKLITLLKSCGI